MARDRALVALAVGAAVNTVTSLPAAFAVVAFILGAGLIAWWLFDH